MRNILYGVTITLSASVKLSLEGLKSWFDPTNDISALYEKEEHSYRRPDKENQSVPFFTKKWGYR